MGTKTVVVPGVGEVLFPDNMSDTQIAAAIRNSSMRPKFNAEAALDTVKDIPRLTGNAVQSLGTGIMDAAVGAGQLVSQMGPQSFTDRYSEAMRSREAEIQAERGDRSGTLDPARIAGNVIPALAMGGGSVPSTLLGRIGLGAKTGGASALVSPVDPDNQNYALTKGLLTAGSAALGAASVPAIEGLVKAASSTANFLYGQGKGLLTPGTSTTSVESALKIELERNGIDWAKLGSERRADLVSMVQNSLKAGGKLDPSAVRRLADFERIGVKPTQGQVTRDPYQFAQEQNLATQEVGRPLAARLNEQNTGFMRVLDSARSGTNASGTDPYSFGKNAIAGIAAKDVPRKAAVDSAYKSFRESVGQEADVPLQPIAQRIGQLIEDMGESNIPGDVVKRLKDFGLFDGKQTRVFNVREAEQLKTLISNNSGPRGSSQERAMTVLKKSVDDAIMGLADDAGVEAASLAKAARDSAAKRFTQLDRAPAYSNVVNKAEDTLAPEKFVEKFFIRGEIQDVANNLRNMVPESRSEVRAGVIDWIKNKSINGTGDAAKFSQSGLNSALKTIGEKRLDLIFAGDRQTLETLKSLARAGQAAQSAPIASGVNYSNSANSILDAMDKMTRLPILGAIAGKPGDIIRASQVAKAIGPVVPTQPMSPLIKPEMADAFGRRLGLLGAPAAGVIPTGLLGAFQ